MNIKLYVMNEEQSRKAQEKALSLGIDWGSRRKNINHLEKPFLFITKYISYGVNYDSFKADNSKELTFEQWMAYDPEKEMPTHEEIMTKWWKHGCGSWFRVNKYYPYYENGKYCIGNKKVNKEYFANCVSADIPPER